MDQGTSELVFGMEMESVFAIVILVIAVMAIAVIVLFILLARMRGRYKRMMAGAQGNVEEMLIAMQANVTNLKEQAYVNNSRLEEIRKTMKKMKARIGIERYNAFSQHGSDMSFSIAILDEEQSGIVLTGIHSREETYIYAKPVEQGQSSYPLSPEERKVIDQTAAQAKTTV
ncbi:MAG: DUF4446 family protein [Cohnella sp.]|nr:DUF4446 family protein [Cohnella sp.]